MLRKENFEHKEYDTLLLIDYEEHYVDPDDSFTPDDSGLYAIVNVTLASYIRVDIMRARDDCPILTITSSNPGDGQALYKWVADNLPEIDNRHLAYLGYELGKAQAYVECNKAHCYKQS